MSEDNYHIILLKAINQLSQYLNNEIDGGNRNFFNEGLIQYKLVEFLALNGIDKSKIFCGFPSRIDVSINDEVSIEIKYIRLAKTEKMMPKTKKYGELWKDIAKLSTISMKQKYALVIYDNKFEIFLKKHNHMCRQKGYILSDDELKLSKKYILSRKSAKIELKKFQLNYTDSLKIVENIPIEENLKLIMYKIN